MHKYKDKDLAKSKRKAWGMSLAVLILTLILSINAIGLIIGSIIYEEASLLPAYSHPLATQRLQQSLKYKGREMAKENIVIESPYGYPLSGTFIPNPEPTNKTIVFVHGFMENRTVGLNYMSLYMQSGFNLLLIDSRDHGESGGDSVTWGNLEKYDLDQWISWVQKRVPNGTIGVHGISMGAATALMHAELNESNKRVAFYIADSAYSDFETLMELQINRYLNSTHLEIAKVLLQYANVVSYFHSRSTFQQASPLRAVQHVTTPILYIHGDADELVPAYMSLELQEATKGPSEVFIFSNSTHGSAIFDDQKSYKMIVQNFIQAVEARG
ncbi:MAG: alpha/beta hydrolase [Acidaminococcaceae bacterium]